MAHSKVTELNCHGNKSITEKRNFFYHFEDNCGSLVTDQTQLPWQ